MCICTYVYACTCAYVCMCVLSKLQNANWKIHNMLMQNTECKMHNAMNMQWNAMQWKCNKLLFKKCKMQNLQVAFMS